MNSQSDQWDLSKENIQPIEHGRKASAIMLNLNENNSAKLLLERQKFEEELRFYIGDDVLDVWFRYIQWTEQNYIKGGADSKLINLVESCMKSIAKDPKLQLKYRDDERFLEISLKYIYSRSSEKIKYYEQLKEKKLFVTLARFYEQWALELERNGHINKANQVFLDAIENKAEPLQQIQNSYERFTSRFAKNLADKNIEQTENQENSADKNFERTENLEYSGPRKVLAAIKTVGSKAKAPVERVASISGAAGKVPSSSKVSNAHGPRFDIFKDGNGEENRPQARLSEPFLPIASHDNKENLKKASIWSKNKLRKANSFPVDELNNYAKTTFSVYTDEPDRNSEVQKLNSAKYIVLTEKGPGELCDFNDIPLFVGEPLDMTKKPQYVKHLIYCGTEEFSFEELRAAQRKNEEEQSKRLEVKIKKEIEEKFIREVEELRLKLEAKEKLIQTIQNESANTQELNSVSSFQNNSKFDKNNHEKGCINSASVSKEHLTSDHSVVAELNERSKNATYGSNNNSTSKETSMTVNTKFANEFVKDIFAATVIEEGDENCTPKFEIYTDNCAPNFEIYTNNENLPLKPTLKTYSDQNNQLKPALKIYNDENEELKEAFKIYNDENVVPKPAFKIYNDENEALKPAFKIYSDENEAPKTAFKIYNDENEAPKPAFKIYIDENEAPKPAFKACDKNEAPKPAFKIYNGENEALKPACKIYDENEAPKLAFKVDSDKNKAPKPAFKVYDNNEALKPSFKVYNDENKALKSALKTYKNENKAGKPAFKADSDENEALKIAFKIHDKGNEAPKPAFGICNYENEAPKPFKIYDEEKEAPKAFKIYNDENEAPKTAFKIYNDENEALKTAFKIYNDENEALKTAFKIYNDENEAPKTAFKIYNDENEAPKTVFKIYNDENEAPKTAFKIHNDENEAPKQFKIYNDENEAPKAAFKIYNEHNELKSNLKNVKIPAAKSLFKNCNNENVDIDGKEENHSAFFNSEAKKQKMEEPSNELNQDLISSHQNVGKISDNCSNIQQTKSNSNKICSNSQQINTNFNSVYSEHQRMDKIPNYQQGELFSRKRDQQEEPFSRKRDHDFKADEDKQCFQDIEQNKENISPINYQKVKRSSTGNVLQPSKDIPFVPLEKQDKNENEEQQIEGIGRLGGGEAMNAQIEDFNTKILTSQKFAELAMASSTPMPFGMKFRQSYDDSYFVQDEKNSAEKLTENDSEKKHASSSSQVDENEQTSGELMPPPVPLCKAVTPTKLSQCPKTDVDETNYAVAAKSCILSPIFESSREMRSSSSSSGASMQTIQTTMHGAIINNVLTQKTKTLSNESYGAHISAVTQMESCGSHVSGMGQNIGLYAAHGEAIGDYSKSGYLGDRESNIQTPGGILKYRKDDFETIEQKSEKSEVNSDKNYLENFLPSEKIENIDRKGEKYENVLKILKKIPKYPKEIDPFCPVLQKQILALLRTPVELRGGYKELTKAPRVRPRETIQLGKESYLVKSQVGSGAYATVFLAITYDPLNVTAVPDLEDNNTESQVILKVQKCPFYWEFYICCELRDRLKAMSDFAYLDCFQRMNRAYFFPKGSILVNEFHKYGTVLDVINCFKQAGKRLAQNLIFFIMVELLEIIKKLHECNIIHGDLKPDNVLLTDIPSLRRACTIKEAFMQNSGKFLKLIDFGRSIDMNVFSNDTQFNVKVSTDGFTCCEMKEDKPWTFQTDYYGLAAIAHILIWGTYMNVQKIDGKWMPHGICYSRYLNREFWRSFFAQLLNSDSSSGIPDLSKIIEQLKGICSMQTLKDDLFSLKSVCGRK